MTRRLLEALARSRQATVTVEKTGGIVTVHVDAPDGHRWQPDDVTAFREEIRGNIKNIDWQAIADRINASAIVADSDM